MERNYRTILWVTVSLLTISFLGFYKTYFGFFPRFEGTSWVVHFHVFTILSWFAMLLAQGWLAKNGRIEQHRKIGRLSYLLAPLILIGFVLITNHGQLKNKDAGLLGATIFDGGMFVLFYVLAIINRRNTAYHARYMILTAIPFINPGLGRFISPAISLPVELVLILALLLTSYFQKKPYKPYLVGMGSFFLLLGFIVYISLINPIIIENIWNAIWG